MTTRKKPATKPAAKPNPNELPVKLTQDKTQERAIADLAANGGVTGADLVRKFNVSTFGDLHLAACVASLSTTAKAIHGGDLKPAETMLVAQAAALNAIFGELARRSSLNMGEHMDATERYMRLALKAQGQCRATLETLAAIKNPPVVFARQANINNGGQQQVVNGAALPVTTGEEQPAPPAGRGVVQSLPAPEPATAWFPTRGLSSPVESVIKPGAEGAG